MHIPTKHGQRYQPLARPRLTFQPYTSKDYQALKQNLSKINKGGLGANLGTQKQQKAVKQRENYEEFGHYARQINKAHLDAHIYRLERSNGFLRSGENSMSEFAHISEINQSIASNNSSKKGSPVSARDKAMLYAR